MADVTDGSPADLEEEASRLDASHGGGREDGGEAAEVEDDSVLAAERSLEHDIETARQDADKYLDDLRRVAADFENYRKRAKREMAENVERASERVLQRLLPVIDSLDLAIDHEPETPGEEKLLAGVKSTRQQLLEALEKEGLEIVPALGEAFDPEVHEAVMVESSGDSLVVTKEMRRGYTLSGRVIRPAMVAVAEDPLAAESLWEPTDAPPIEDGDG